jgi:hypothetical protein
MALDQNGRLSKIEELIIKHDVRMDELQHLIVEIQQNQVISNRALENTERLLVLEGDRIDRLERIEARQNELFAEIAEQLRHFGGH